MTKRIVAGNDSAFSYVRIKYGANATDTVTGVIIYPDDFTFSEAGVGAMNFGCYPVTQIDAVTWEALEDVGCVFLPGAGYRGFKEGRANMDDTNIGGTENDYWTATASSADKAYYVFFKPGEPSFRISQPARYWGFSIRLVQDY